MKKSKCKKCNDTGWFRYDEHHGQVCDACCKHDKGFFLLKEHYGKDNGKFCCLNGCGFVKKKDCECACHDNPLLRPLAHDKRCCDGMNGFVKSKDNWEEEFDDNFIFEMMTEEFAPSTSPDQVKNFIKKLLAKERKEIKKEIDEFWEGYIPIKTHKIVLKAERKRIKEIIFDAQVTISDLPAFPHKQLSDANIADLLLKLGEAKTSYAIKKLKDTNKETNNEEKH